jgi:hypothetical protein
LALAPQVWGAWRQQQLQKPSPTFDDPNGANRDRTGDLLLANWAELVAGGRHWAAMANADAAMYQIKAGAPAVGSRTSRDPLGYLTKT